MGVSIIDQKLTSNYTYYLETLLVPCTFLLPIVLMLEISISVLGVTVTKKLHQFK